MDSGKTSEAEEKGFNYHDLGTIVYLKRELEDIEFEAIEKKYGIGSKDSLNYIPEKFVKLRSSYIDSRVKGLIGNCVGTDYAILAIIRTRRYEQYKAQEKFKVEKKKAVSLARKDGEQKCIRDGKLHVTQAFIDSKIELARKDAFGTSSIILKEMIERIKKQNDIDWNDGSLVLKQHRQNRKAFPVPESMIEQFEIMLEVMEENSDNKLKEVEARVEKKTAKEKEQIFEEIEHCIWNRGKDDVANIHYKEFGNIKNRFLSKSKSGSGK